VVAVLETIALYREGHQEGGGLNIRSLVKRFEAKITGGIYRLTKKRGLWGILGAWFLKKGCQIRKMTFSVAFP
jgi:hypothetical protein